MLSRFGAMSNEQIKDAILHLDSEAIPLENLQSLTQYVPLPEEVEQLKEFVNSPIDMLGKAEAFIICMMSIPLLGPKLSAWEYMRSFEGKFGAVDHVRACCSSTAATNSSLSVPEHAYASQQGSQAQQETPQAS